MNQLKKVQELLRGKKTYLIAFAIGAVVVLNHLGYLPQETAEVILGLLGAGGLVTLRSGLKTETRS